MKLQYDDDDDDVLMDVTEEKSPLFIQTNQPTTTISSLQRRLLEYQQKRWNRVVYFRPNSTTGIIEHLPFEILLNVFSFLWNSSGREIPSHSIATTHLHHWKYERTMTTWNSNKQEMIEKNRMAFTCKS